MIAGGTGFIGECLVAHLTRNGCELVLLSRSDRSSPGPMLRYCKWDARTPGRWEHELETTDAVINLAGAPIAEKRWSEKQKKSIVESRIHATRALIQAIEKVKTRPKVLINASAIGYYGDVPEEDLTETSSQGMGFLADTCEQWEKEARIAEKWGIRTVLLRTGIVLGEGGGALAKMVLPFRFFMGGSLGSGRQWVSWIHREDVVGIIKFILENDVVAGPVNATAPNPLRMYEFCREVGKVLKRPSWFSVPSFVLKLIFGEMSATFLTGQKVIPQKLLAHHYPFKFPDLQTALVNILNKRET